jgi:nucleotide-binding universal stress UspA family protein
MIALKHVLVATDFSQCSDAAVAQARAVAEAFGATLHVLHVVSEPLHETWACYAPHGGFLDRVEQLQDEAQRKIEAAIAQEPGAADRVVVETAWGDPGEKILEYAKTNNVDLIVCGTHGRRGWDHLVMGSVAERLVRLAPCPVLTVHAGARTATAA